MSFDLHPLPTGEYNIFAVNYRVTPPEQLPLGLSRTNTGSYRIIFLPAGSTPTKFTFAKQGQEQKYSIVASGLSILPVDNYPAAVDTSLSTYMFSVERSAPSLPPIGHDSFVIYAHPAPEKGQFWAPGCDGDNETLVVFRDVGHIWYITPVGEP